jgi:hypothetical protein
MLLSLSWSWDLGVAAGTRAGFIAVHARFAEVSEHYRIRCSPERHIHNLSERNALARAT